MSRGGAHLREELWRKMRVPLLTFGALVVFLAVNITLGWLTPFHGVWILELGVLVAMIATVLLFSMEVIEEPALIRLFSLIGFCWVGIMFAMVLNDYLNR